MAFIAEWTFKTIVFCAAVAFAVECLLKVCFLYFPIVHFILTSTKFKGDQGKSQVGVDSMASVMDNQALHDYIKEQIARNSVEKYIQSVTFAEKQGSAATRASTAIISDYDPLEETQESGGSKAIARTDIGRDLGAPKAEIGEIAIEAEHQKYQDL